MTNQHMHERLTAWHSAWVVAIALVTLAWTDGAPAQNTRTAAADGNSKNTRQDASGENQHPLDTPLKLARRSLDAVEKITDFEGEFTKREVIGNSMIVHVMQIKHRVEPFSVYLRFTQPHQGREVIFVDGKNQGKLLVHETGLASLAGTIALAPTSTMALSESRHPITHIGLKNLVGGMIDIWENERKYGEVSVKYYNNAKLHDMECLVIEVTHPRPRKQFEHHVSRLFLEKKSNLPVRVEHYGFPTRSGATPPLMEEYTYSNIRPNVGLSDVDFDPNNPRYNY